MSNLILRSDLYSMSEAELVNAIEAMTDDERNDFLATTKDYRTSKVKDPLAYFVPLPGDQEAYLNSLSKIKFEFGGNGAGKTFPLCKEGACKMMGYDPSGATPEDLYNEPPNKVWFGSVKRSKAYAILTQTMLPMFPPGYIVRTDKQNDVLYGKDGSELHLLTYKSDISAWQSEAVDHVMLDEQPPQQYYDEAISRIARTGGSLSCAMTPFYSHSAWTYNEIWRNQNSNPNIECFIVDTLDNTYLTDEMRQFFRECYEGTVHEETRLHGKFAVLQGLVHPDFDRRIHVLQAPIDWTEGYKQQFRFARTIDAHSAAGFYCNWFAFREHPTPIVYVFKELVMKNIHVANFGKMVIEQSEGFPIDFTIFDSAESTSEMALGTSMRYELNRLGIATQESYSLRNFQSGVQRFNQYLAAPDPKIFFTPDCTYTINTVESYMYPNASEIDPEKPIQEKPKFKDDHCVRNIHFFLNRMPSLNQEMDSIFRYDREFQYNTYLPKGMFRS